MMMEMDGQTQMRLLVEQKVTTQHQFQSILIQMVHVTLLIQMMMEMGGQIVMKTTVVQTQQILYLYP